MRTSPVLLPLPPTSGVVVSLSTSPFWIGSASGCTLRLHLPGIAGRHASILEREDGYWLTAGPGVIPPPVVNGSAVDSELMLSHGDVIELAPGVRYRFDSAEPSSNEHIEDEPEPLYADIPAPRKRRRRRGLTKAQRRSIRFAALAAVAVIVVLGLLALAVVMLLRAL